MSILAGILLGVVQGITEFVPVSSSGHLIVARDVFGLATPNPLAVDAVLQLATACSIFVFFAPSIWRWLKQWWETTGKDVSDEAVAGKQYLVAIAVGTVPAVIAGLLLESYMETVFRSPAVVAVTLVIGGLLMYVADRVGKRDSEVNTKNGLVVGLFQCLALVPGMSRSGSTIAGGLLAGFNRARATEFSFALGLPILFGSGAKKTLELYQSGAMSDIGVALLVGSISAFVTGLIAMRVLIRFVQTNRLDWFVYYRFVVAILILLFVI